jgi:hypothetical protein
LLPHEDFHAELLAHCTARRESRREPLPGL